MRKKVYGCFYVFFEKEALIFPRGYAMMKAESKTHPKSDKKEEKMEENKEKLGDAPIKVRSPFYRWLDNFWYHYKWHTLIALFVVFVIVVCTLQTCSRESYDIHILYAGNREIKRTSSSGGVIEYETFLDDLSRVSEDFDGNGKIGVSLKTLFSLTAEEIEKVEATPGMEVNYTLLQQDASTLSGLLTVGDYYLCFLSESVYRDKRERDGVPLFVSLTPYTAGIEGVRYVDGAEDAVYLSSLSFGSLPLLSELPEDTVICLRALTPVAEQTDRNSRTTFERSETVLKNILSYKRK